MAWVATAIVFFILLLVVSQREQHDPGPLTDEQRHAFEHELALALAEGRKIDAIKAHRRLHGSGLREAKDAIEVRLAGHAPR